MRLFIFLVSVTCSAGLADICCFPKQWEGTLSVWLPNYPRGDRFAAQMNSDISVDMIGQRVRIYNRPADATQLYFFKEGVAYVITNTTCDKGSASPWPRSAFCVPGDAKLMRKYQLGVKEKINVIDYMFTTNLKSAKGVMMQTIRTVTDMCQPVEDKVIRKYSESNNTDVFSETYENITPGIKDPNVFNIPSICKASTRQMKDSPARRVHSFRDVMY